MIVKGKDFRLPKAFKKKWIAALRSGDFEQGRGKLHNRDSNTYCCLGVACRIVYPKKNLGINSYIYNGPRLRLVPKILKWDGDNEDNPIVEKLVSMNDKDRKSFKVIVMWIEKNL